MADLRFSKMHGLGNDFVVFDGRRRAVRLETDQVRAVANRRTGVGCDQLIILEPARNVAADVFIRIYNADGGEVFACGNAARCVAALIMDERRADEAVIETAHDLLRARRAEGGMIAVDMGPVRTAWNEIPLAEPRDTLHLGIALGALADPVAVNVGNPHAVFFVDDAEAVDLGPLGSVLECHELFPERTNVEAAAVLSPSTLRVRVWERGVGITPACGSGACAALVAANLRGLAASAGEVILDGGTLGIERLDDGHVLMTGPVAAVFSGTLDPSLASAS
ncbi:MAG: diaminopimelate epimerase [Rhodospirillales bacterium]|jgi:diaminopimelate epimerase|nr:diaminopimelate epimerase [Rhodospirillales bacterium]MDP6804242.1 diaminopimelate epimerase [Rhodospirillales bacterium]